MKIALIGYGKMGKAIEKLALPKRHELIICRHSSDINQLSLEKPDVAIEFTNPESAYFNIRFCLESGIPIVCGTTGWLSAKPALDELCKAKNGAFFYSSNFSLGVNLFFRLNQYLAKVMGTQKSYDVFLTEIHHTEKKDSPSGTAITLALDILKERTDLRGWSIDGLDPNTLPIHSERKDPFPGTHEIIYKSKIDEITITHAAHSREGFASGALAVAEWIPGKKGILGMKDFLPF